MSHLEKLMLFLSASCFVIEQQWGLGKNLVSLLVKYGLSPVLTYSTAWGALVPPCSLFWSGMYPYRSSY